MAIGDQNDVTILRLVEESLQFFRQKRAAIEVADETLAWETLVIDGAPFAQEATLFFHLESILFYDVKAIDRFYLSFA
ncbi:hypothetical protein DAPPUDRAFT_265270 [Daphnia pulex]|uniref:Uncharacterized protein n=1 Tax=Daphnia pulex TaxID=6669 RepID=E9HT60_DAPPU|nr:hypothetical protein DAPPUDRAFT_265270 [Daphnia pulex]|eukprot:EFX65071.1 hypothetical protein DAPPUDRAFT_265270 [Daphnia pulex]